MAKIKSLNELKEAAADVFAHNEDAKEVLAVEDGQIFLAGKENAAKNHAFAQAEGDKSLKIHTIKREDVEVKGSKSSEPSKSTSKPSVEERIAAIEACETVEAVEELLKEETAKTVKKAAEDHIEKLIKEGAAKAAHNEGSEEPESGAKDENPKA